MNHIEMKKIYMEVIEALEVSKLKQDSNLVVFKMITDQLSRHQKMIENVMKISVLPEGPEKLRLAEKLAAIASDASEIDVARQSIEIMEMDNERFGKMLEKANEWLTLEDDPA